MNDFSIKVIGKPEKWLIEAAEEIGIDLTSRIPAIIQAPDMAIIGARRKQRILYIVYAQIETASTYFYFEQILDSRKNKALRGSTFYKVTRPLLSADILRNVTRNNKTDISGAKIVTLVKA